jgi:hypothetical protein
MGRRRALTRNLELIERDLAIAQDQVRALQMEVKDRNLLISEGVATVQGLLRDHGESCGCGHVRQAKEFIRVGTTT